jgi:kynurenine formamidase|tara:strand:+ start:919 stop:1569 length:651 start_codon:yes stop_codon:yes gene_type:complete
MKILDLTLTVSDKIPTFPGSPQPNFIPWENIKDDGYNLELLFLSSHTGTHLDAPYHFIENGTKIHEISPNRLIRDAVLIKSRKKSGQAITKTDILKFEKMHEKIPNGSTVIFWTGWQKMLHDDSYFIKNPGLSTTAAKYLVSKKTNLVGIDSPSIDFQASKQFSVHHLFSKNGILILENLANLEKIKSWKFQLVVLPLKLKNATGSPVRAVAVLEK